MVALLSTMKLVSKNVLILLLLFYITEGTRSCAETIMPYPPEDSDFMCPEPFGLYPHPERCELYYSCVDRVATLYPCIEPRLFDVRVNNCNSPENTDCGNRTQPGYPSSTPPPFECPGEAVDDWFADPNDCASFYRCVAGYKFHFQCAWPTLFDDVKKQCDHHTNVTCGIRPRP